MLTAENGGELGYSWRIFERKYSSSKFSLCSLMMVIILTISAYCWGRDKDSLGLGRRPFRSASNWWKADMIWLFPFCS